MTRYQKTFWISFLVWLFAAAAGVIWFQLMRASSSARIVGGETAILIIAFAINQAALILPLRRRFAAAVERQDAAALDAVLDEQAEMWPHNPNVQAFIDINRAVALMYRERWDEAVAQTRSTLARPLARTQESLLLNNLAWSLAHTGALDEAVAIGERALAEAQTEELRSFANGTLGSIYALRGDADRAIEHLNTADAITIGGGAIQATRHYYRAVAFQSQGRLRDAIRALEAARDAAPASAFGRRSESLLADLRKA